MNVGPTSRGNFDKRADKALEVFADWMDGNSRSIYGCTKAEPEFIAPQGTILTQSEDGQKLYIHLVDYPFSALEMEMPAGKIDYAQLLHDGSEVAIREKDGIVTFLTPGIKPEQTITVIEVFLK